MIFSTIERTKIKRSAILFSALLLMGVFPFATKAIAQPELTDEENSRSRQWLESYQTDSPESTLMRALMSLHYQPSSTLISFRSTELGDSETRLILSLMIYQCANYPRITYCDGASLENELVELDPENLVPYLHRFNHFLATDDIDSALASLEEGLTTTETNDYYFDKVMYLREELESIGFYGDRANLAAEVYSLNGLLPTYSKIIPTCVEQAKSSHKWKSTCLELGPRLEQGTTFFSNVYGAAIQRDVVAAISSDAQEIEEALEHRAFYDDFRINARSKLPWWDDLALRPNSYYENASQFGELQAIQIEIDQVRDAPVR